MTLEGGGEGAAADEAEEAEVEDVDVGDAAVDSMLDDLTARFETSAPLAEESDEDEGDGDESDDADESDSGDE